MVLGQVLDATAVEKEKACVFFLRCILYLRHLSERDCGICR